MGARKIMKLKLFGKNIFEYNKGRALYEGESRERLKEETHLPNFYSLVSRHGDMVELYADAELMLGGSKKKKKKKGEGIKVKLTPKAIYEMEMLNDKNVKIITDKEYVDEQLEQFTDKLNLIKASTFDMSRGTLEISSILIRLENRKKYHQFKGFFENYAYTTTSKISTFIKKHSYLKIDEVEQFLADMPKEAIKEMKDYEKNTKKLCGKKPVFYILADKKDFERSSKRRDPILLAQSPFAHNWQILGAWDKEMLLLEEL